MRASAPALSAGPAAAPALGWALGALAVAWLYALAWPTTTPDMGNYLLPWYAHIRAHGPLAAFAHPFSNYTPPYLYLLALISLLDGLASPFTLIKLLSVLGAGALALAMRSLLRALAVPHAERWAAGTFLLPTVVINAPFLGQCDAFWAAACVMATAAAVERRLAAMLAWCGVAVAFKLQAVFLAPFAIAALLAARARWRLWLVPPLTYAALMLPAFALGWPAADLATIHLRQAEYSTMLGNLANPWGVAQWLGAPLALAPLGYAAAAAASLAVIALLARRGPLAPRETVAAAAFSALLLPFLLPKMHERYYFLADLLAIALALAARERRAALAAVAVQAASLLSLLAYTVNRPLFVAAGAPLAAAALWALWAELRPPTARTCSAGEPVIGPGASALARSRD